MENEFISKLSHNELSASSSSIANYSISSTRMAFKIDNPFEFNVPYFLTKSEFKKNISEIEKALVWFHELTHYIQSWSTTNGILQFMLYTYVNDQLRHVRERTTYKLPLKNHFDILIKNVYEIDDNDRYFTTLFTGHLLFKWNYSWFSGTLIPNVSEITNLQDVKFKFYDSFYIKDILFHDPQKYDGHGFKSLDNGGVSTNEYIIDFDNPGFQGISKEIGLFRFPYFRNENNNPDGLFSISTMQLMECFAKSVEFEHLLKFNTEIGGQVIDSWIRDKNAKDYNLVFHLFNLMVGIKGTQINWPWAHLRLLIDISLMYSDFLNIDINEFNDPFLSDKLFGIKSNPGITFFNVLVAFNECEPLKDYYGDLIRLYNEICNKLNFPSLQDMTSRLIAIVQSIKKQKYMQGSLMIEYLNTAELLLQEKLSNPIFFVNDLIDPSKYDPIIEILDGKYAVVTPNSYTERKDQVTLFYDIHDEVVEQAINNENFICPLSTVLERVIQKGFYSGICLGKKTGRKECINCIVGPLVDAWLKNRRH